MKNAVFFTFIPGMDGDNFHRLRTRSRQRKGIRAQHKSKRDVCKIKKHMRSGIVHIHTGNVHLYKSNVHVHKTKIHMHKANVHVNKSKVHVHKSKMHMHTGDIHVHNQNVHMQIGNVHVHIENVHMQNRNVHVHIGNVHVQNQNVHIHIGNMHMHYRNVHLHIGKVYLNIAMFMCISRAHMVEKITNNKCNSFEEGKMNTTSLTNTTSETQKEDPVRKRKRLTYAEKINLAKVLTEALNKNLDQLSAVGITEDFAKELDEQRKIAEALNIEQEKLKADLKSKTDALRIEMIKLASLFGRGKKLVKIQVPIVQWKEFGIADKK